MPRGCGVLRICQLVLILIAMLSVSEVLVKPSFNQASGNELNIPVKLNPRCAITISDIKCDPQVLLNITL